MANSAVSLNIPDPATQADMETATDVTKVVTPGRVKFHPGACKVWGNVTNSGGGVPALQASYNMTSIADTGTGQITFTIATDFSSVNWSCTASGKRPGGNSGGYIQQQTKDVGTILIYTFAGGSSTSTFEDWDIIDMQGLGDQ
jgi:hypothetical protein